MANNTLNSNKRDPMARRREGALKRSVDMPPRPPKKGEGSKEKPVGGPGPKKSGRK